MPVARNDLAEKALLASVFNDTQIIGEISDLVKPEDFFEPRHELIYQTVLKLYQGGKDFSPVSVVADLQRDNLLSKAGDIGYLRELVNPSELFAMSADPIGFAFMVKEASKLRELGKAAETIGQVSEFGSGLNADEAISVAESAIIDIVNRETSSETMKSVVELLPEVIQDIRDAENLPEGVITGIPSGFLDLDNMTSGFKGGQMIIIAARPAVGKAGSLSTVVWTKAGRKTLGEIKAGDEVYGNDGKLYKVIKAHEIYNGLDAYEVKFSDGTTITVNEEHLWYTETHAARKSRRAVEVSTAARETVFTEEIQNKLKLELDATNPHDTMTLFELAQVMGWPSANPSMISIASHLSPVSQKIHTRQVMRKTKVFNSEKFFADIVANEKLVKIHNDSVILKKVTDLVHSSKSQQLTVREIATAIFGEESGEAEYSYISKIIRRAKTPSEQVDSLVEYPLGTPSIAYSKLELLGAWYKHACSAQNDQRDKAINGSVKTTLEIKDTLLSGNGEIRWNHSIPVAQPINLPEADLPIAPYALGAWLGDGNSATGTICGEDHEVFDYIERLGYTHTKLSRSKEVHNKTATNHNVNFRVVKYPELTRSLRSEGLLLKSTQRVKVDGSLKHIPASYLQASIHQRRELLAGLMDTDGYAAKNSSVVQFFNSNKRLIDDTVHLAASLGYRPVVASKLPVLNGKEMQRAYSVTWSTNDDVFKLSRKVAIHRAGVKATFNNENNDRRYIVAVNKVDSVPMRCLTVDSPDSLFLVGDTLIATHNSTLAVDFGRNAAFLAGKTVLFFSLEMGAKELVARIISAEARVETQKIKSGELTETDWMNVMEAKSKLEHGTFLIDSNPNASVSRIRSVATRQKLRPEGLDMIIVDYLQLMEASPVSGQRNASRENIVSEMSRGIKILAKDLDVPIIILSQLNRKAEERQDGKPQVSDLRESGSLEQDADMVLLIHRPESTDQNNRPGEADLIIGKHRGGPTGRIPLTSMLAFSKFVPGQGITPREEELVGDGSPGGEFATTEDETPW